MILIWLNCKLISSSDFRFLSCSSLTLLSDRSMEHKFWK